jgi:TetR/AcrR family transcriptional repressor of nem operon
MSTSPPVATSERILQAAQDLAFERGFEATTVDAILTTTGLSKGAFFHHFPSKAALGEALLARYAQFDAEVLEEHMARAEAASDDPAQQLIAFVRSFEDDVDADLVTQPGCLFASFVYERMPGEPSGDDVIERAISLWRDRILEKLRQVEQRGGLAAKVDLTALADHVWTVFEGGFLLSRATGDVRHLRDQLAQLRAYLTLLLQPAS